MAVENRFFRIPENPKRVFRQRRISEVLEEVNGTMMAMIV